MEHFVAENKMSGRYISFIATSDLPQSFGQTEVNNTLLV